MNNLAVWLQRLAVGGIIFFVFTIAFYLLSVLLPIVFVFLLVYLGSRLVRNWPLQSMTFAEKNEKKENPACRKNRKPEIIDAEYEIIDTGK